MSAEHSHTQQPTQRIYRAACVATIVRGRRWPGDDVQRLQEIVASTEPGCVAHRAAAWQLRKLQQRGATA